MVLNFLYWDFDSWLWILLFLVILIINIYFSKFVFFLNKFIVWFFGFFRKDAKKTPVIFYSLLESLKIRKVSSKTIVLTIALVLAFELAYYLLFQTGEVSPIKGNPLIIILLVPIIEEFVYRGLFFGLLLVLVNSLNLKDPLLKNTFLFLALLTQSIIFAMGHESATRSVLLGGFLFGLLFLYSKKNLLPGILAHTIHNLLMILIFCF